MAALFAGARRPEVRTVSSKEVGDGVFLYEVVMGQ